MRTIGLTYNANFLLQLYMAPVTNSQRYHDSIYFWRDVYGIKSEL
jgi:hypothetical protein